MFEDDEINEKPEIVMDKKWDLAITTAKKFLKSSRAKVTGKYFNAIDNTGFKTMTFNSVTKLANAINNNKLTALDNYSIYVKLTNINFTPCLSYDLDKAYKQL
jgi:hypothetical protein